MGMQQCHKDTLKGACENIHVDQCKQGLVQSVSSFMVETVRLPMQCST